MFGIEGFDPEWKSGARSLWHLHGADLSGLVGRRLRACWLVWDSSDDSWFADAPVVLDFEGRHLEICHNKFDELDIAWNRIDLLRPILWRYDDDGPMPLSWCDDRAPELDRFRGRVLRRCTLEEWVDDDVANGMVAVGFTFDNGGFLVSNGLDENQIDVRPVGSHFRRVG
ncbi:hypothetical protein WBG06_03035 [Nocardioides sp. CCNWLW239]|uniref:hypothetical protein n=1 Tax=Nocardioides sp. CCNWLW239 TaxID=3128902 RepID=UPI003015B516